MAQEGSVVNVTERQRRGYRHHLRKDIIPGNPQPATTHEDDQFAIMGPGYTYESVTEKISSVVLSPRISIGYAAALAFTVSVLGMLGAVMLYLFLMGVGIWGVNIPIGWGFAIINFVWWIGIGHAGTLISAILLLLHQNWRTSINRFAEAMTLFAVACAGLYPLLHVGRHQYAYWMMPFPNTMGLWPQFRSPLIWDVFAVSTYATVSLLFWYVGMIPDLATLRDRATSRIAKIIYGILALGWRGSGRHWHRYNALYILLAGLATPLVVSVHTVISWDFSVGIVPGWHSTIFPPYFVAGALYGGFAMVLILAVPLRVFCGWKDFITLKHLENCGKLMLASGLVVFYGYAMELFMGWFSANKYEQFMTLNRMIGPYWPAYWSLILCNGLIPQLLWFRKMRTSPAVLFIISVIVSVGMFLERFVIIVTSLHRDFLPSKWGMYYPTIFDIATFAGTFGLFFTLFLLFARFLPAISIAEMRELVLHHGHSASFATSAASENGE